MASPKKAHEAPGDRLEHLIEQALQLTKKARKHRKGLRGDNFYANKLAELRADATNAFQSLSASSTGDTTALAELLNALFSADTPQEQRIATARELTFALRTTWRSNSGSPPPTGGDEVFPLGIIGETKRGYLMTISRQMNGAFGAGWYDASAVMLRRLFEICIIEAFENKAISQKIKDGAGNYVQLTDLVDRTLAESTWSLSRNARKYLPQLKDLGHKSAHGRYYLARKADIEMLRPGCRVVIEELLHHAGLLQ